MTTTAFIAGATGLTGRYVVERLASRGDRAIAHVRPDSPRLEEWRGRFAAMGAAVDTTPWDPNAMRASIAKLRPKLVFGCLGTTQARVRAAARDGRDASKETYDAVDVAMTETLIAACRDAGVERFVYLSSIGAGGTSGNAYLAARTRVENTLRASGVPYTIVRPSFILGDRDEERTGERAFGAIADAALGLLGALGAQTVRDRYRSIRAEDLAAAMVRLAEDERWKNHAAHTDDLRERRRG